MGSALMASMPSRGADGGGGSAPVTPPIFSRLELPQQRRADDWAGLALLQQHGAPIGPGPHEAVALQLDGHRLAAPHADRYQLPDHIVVGDGLALVLAAPYWHSHALGDHGK